MYSGTTVKSPAGMITAQVLIGGVAQPLYRRADGRHFTAGIPGTPYTVRVSSLIPDRAEVIASVDGRHVLDDEPADLYRCRGLVIGPQGTYEFKGWRISDAQTREFTFGAPQSSVAAAATGSTVNTGVIGIAAHRERRLPVVTFASGASMDCAAAHFTAPTSYSANDLTRSASLGTGMGAAQHDPVGRTEFTRDASCSPDILVIGYGTEDALREMGCCAPPTLTPFPGTRATGYANFPR